MNFNKTAVQKELDLAADELDKRGYLDLADKVDVISAKLMEKPSENEIQEIRRSLARVHREAVRREMQKVSSTDDKETKDRIERLRKKRSMKIKAFDREYHKKLVDQKKFASRKERIKKLFEQRQAKNVEKVEPAAKEEKTPREARKDRIASKK